ncbi:MAG: hypothetical protein ACM3U2_12575 [Deltaproteobacteria bacterium]
MRESLNTRFKPAVRRWNFFGIVLGTAPGAVPAAIPSPVGPVVTWVTFGAMVGFIIPMGMIVHGHFCALA